MSSDPRYVVYYCPPNGSTDCYFSKMSGQYHSTMGTTKEGVRTLNVSFLCDSPNDSE